jgi:hypothetical protein
MSSSDGPRFSCPTCGKSYRWKLEFAGRSAKCACGAKLVVPMEAASTSGAADTRAAPGPKRAESTRRAATSAQSNNGSACPSCSASLATDAVLCINCGFNLKTGKKLAAVVVETDAEEQAEDDAPPEEDKRAPGVEQ